MEDNFHGIVKVSFRKSYFHRSFLKAFVEDPVEGTPVEASIAFVETSVEATSMKASMEGFVEASIKVTLWKLSWNISPLG